MSKNIDGIIQAIDQDLEKAQSEQSNEPAFATAKRKSRRKLRISEKTRTALLLILLIAALGFIYSIQNSVDSNFIETL